MTRKNKVTRDLKIVEGCERNMTIPDIAVYADCSENAVMERMGRLITEKERKAVVERNVDGMVQSQLDKMDELWITMMEAVRGAKNTMEKGNVATQGLKFIDTWVKMMTAFGIAIPKSEYKFELQPVRDTPEYQQFIGLFEGWCMELGLDITDFYAYVDRETNKARKAKKKERVIEIEGTEVEE